MKKSEQEEFLAQTERSGSCLLWAGAKYGSGYGCFKQKRAHRVSYELFVGPVGDNHVLHTCDEPLCVEPGHLWLGSHADKMRDKVNKGRCNSPKGERHGSAKLTKSKVQRIRYLWASGQAEPYSQLGRIYGVSASAIRGVVLGLTWRE